MLSAAGRWGRGGSRRAERQDDHQEEKTSKMFTLQRSREQTKSCRSTTLFNRCFISSVSCCRRDHQQLIFFFSFFQVVSFRLKKTLPKIPQVGLTSQVFTAIFSHHILKKPGLKKLLKKKCGLWWCLMITFPSRVQIKCSSLRRLWRCRRWAEHRSASWY